MAVRRPVVFLGQRRKLQLARRGVGVVAQEFRRFRRLAAIVVDPVLEGVEGLEVAVDVVVVAVKRP